MFFQMKDMKSVLQQFSYMYVMFYLFVATCSTYDILYIFFLYSSINILYLDHLEPVSVLYKCI